jgi:uncharacterized membrane protein
MMSADFDMAVWVTIAAAALVTYGLRISGLLLAGRLPQTGRFKVFLDTLPGTILLSLVVPGILAEGILGGAAALATGLITRLTGNLFISMLVGVGIVAVGRQLQL